MRLAFSVLPVAISASCVITGCTVDDPAMEMLMAPSHEGPTRSDPLYFKKMRGKSRENIGGREPTPVECSFTIPPPALAAVDLVMKSLRVASSARRAARSAAARPKKPWDLTPGAFALAHFSAQPEHFLWDIRCLAV